MSSARARFIIQKEICDFSFAVCALFAAFRRSVAVLIVVCSVYHHYFPFTKEPNEVFASATRSNRQERMTNVRTLRRSSAGARFRRSIVPIQWQKRHCYSHPIINKSASNFVLSSTRLGAMIRVISS